LLTCVGETIRYERELLTCVGETIRYERELLTCVGETIATSGVADLGLNETIRYGGGEGPSRLRREAPASFPARLRRAG
jgi:hypothetical protein